MTKTSTLSELAAMAPLDQNDQRWKSFEEAFTERGGGCVRKCACGHVFFNSDGGWDWEPGELEQLKKWAAEGPPTATDLEWAASYIEFEGALYVIDCSCWRLRASRIICWLENHRFQLAHYLNAEKKRRERNAAAEPTVAT